MIASYLLASTMVPVLAVRLFQGTRADANIHAHGPASGRVGGITERYGRFADGVVRARWVVLLVYAAVCIPAFFLVRSLGTELFPRVDTGQFQLRIRAPAGTRLEKTVDIVRGVDQAIRDEVGPAHVGMTLANVGTPAWTYPVNAIYVFNSGPQDAVLLAQLQGRDRPRLDALQERLRLELGDKYPAVHFSFEAGDIVSQVLTSAAP